MSTFRVIYDPKTKEINATPLREPKEDYIGKIVTYMKADSPTPAINRAMGVINRDKSSILALVGWIAQKVGNLQTQVSDTHSITNQIYAEQLRLLKVDNLKMSDKGRFPFIALSRFYQEWDWEIGTILSRLELLKDEIEKEG